MKYESIGESCIAFMKQKQRKGMSTGTEENEWNTDGGCDGER